MEPFFVTFTVLVLSVFMSFLRRHKPLKKWLASKLENSINSFQRYPSVSPNFKLEDSPYFTKQQTLHDISTALSELIEFKIRALRQNGSVYNRTKALKSHEISQLENIGYFDKIEAVNLSIDVNFHAINLIVLHTLNELVKMNGITPYIEGVLKDVGYTWDEGNKKLVRNTYSSIHFSEKSNQYRVNEAICHLVRDWSDDYSLERQQLLDFIDSSISNSVAEKDTLIIVPGSGCGRIAYEIAKKYKDSKVESIEFSSLMYLCNEFVLGAEEEITIDPFYQCYSGQRSKNNQTRGYSINVNEFSRPENHTLHLGDFSCYRPERKYENIIVCTAFFIDTAENMFDYFNAIENLSNFVTGELHWVNVGPLKYGTRPKVQLNYEELSQIRKLRGWKDHSSKIDAKNLVGYVTDYESLYQGFYGLVKFHSELER